jgi:uncharacterized protein
MTSNCEIVGGAFAAWAEGTAPITAIFADDMTWEIAGRSAAAGTYESTEQFVDQVLRPFGARFSATAPFRPVEVRSIYADEGQSTVAVVWDGEGTTVAGTTYRNTYAWFLTMAGGKVTHGLAFYDSLAFDELWTTVTPAQGS